MATVEEKRELTFEDGILLCKHIYQCAIHKTLNGVIEEWEILYKTHALLNELLDKQEFNQQRLGELLFEFNIENAYTKM